ncbi:hypothetical protein [Flavobacterium sp.]|uniref:hypothetical protein n=1 Tax=Flavobacterium sp. TaxID=239 RepID=UPI00286E75A2|nr:hypothetical protein [Flavobacterium sp.]
MPKKIASNNNQSFKIIIILLTICLLGSMFYIYKMSDRSKNIIVSLREEKLTLLKDLEKSKLFIEVALSSKSAISNQLDLEKEKVKNLISKIKNNNLNKTQITQYKKGADNINFRISSLLKELDYYKKKSDSTALALDNQRVVNDTLLNSNKILSNKISSASNLYYYNIKASAYKLKNSGDKIETEKARKTDVLKISFSIAQNNLVKASNNKLLIQIIDSKNNVLGSKKTEQFGKDNLTYSFATDVKYINKTISIEKELAVENLEKGLFYVNVFDKSKVVLHTSFTLL